MKGAAWPCPRPNCRSSPPRLFLFWVSSIVLCPGSSHPRDWTLQTMWGTYSSCQPCGKVINMYTPNAKLATLGCQSQRARHHFYLNLDNFLFSLFVKHYDKITSCLGETAYQTFHQGRMTVKGTHFFFQDKKTQRQNLVGYKWADGQELTPRGGWRRSYQLRSWRHSVRLGFCSRSVSELGMKDWTIQPTWDLELHNADGFLQSKWEKNKTTWAHIFKAQLWASWLLLSTVS